MDQHYDVIIIGSGAGGGTLAHRLAPSGKRILLLERGAFLPREKQNWDVNAVFRDNRYVSPDTWYDQHGKPFQPGSHYFVGGATKLYGAALFRMRREDFNVLKHHDGISPAWPIAYEDLEPSSAPESSLSGETHSIAGVGHQAGTCRFGTDASTSVLDINCKAHEVANLYVVDTSFFPSIAGVNPSLTAMANALRVGDHLLERLG